ncbi:hypothetical protein [Streptomyces xanthophaeus]|uniref:hypothetical protein n=1 Tax=Streptomyces xanthophaeus TaxID=67385 RepID=UPI0036592CF6
MKEEFAAGGDSGVTVAGRSGNLFGWALDREAIALLAATGTLLDVDEYDMTPSPPSA